MSLPSKGCHCMKVILTINLPRAAVALQSSRLADILAIMASTRFVTRYAAVERATLLPATVDSNASPLPLSAKHRRPSRPSRYR